MNALDWLMKFLKQKRQVMPGTDWWFHWDNAPVHIAAVVTNWVVARQIKVIQYPPYPHNLSPA